MISTVYKGLTTQGEWILFKSKKPVRNRQKASDIAKKEIIEFRTAPVFYQIFNFFIKNT